MHPHLSDYLVFSACWYENQLPIAMQNILSTASREDVRVRVISKAAWGKSGCLCVCVCGNLVNAYHTIHTTSAFGWKSTLTSDPNGACDVAGKLVGEIPCICLCHCGMSRST